MATLLTELVVDLPPKTPSPAFLNVWTLAYFLDDLSSSSAAGEGSVTGFNIVPMSASLQCNNQMSAVARGYFTLQPRTGVSAGWQILVTPPPLQGYAISCWGLEKVTMPRIPECTSVAEDETLTLTIPDGGELVAGRSYTVGISLTNAWKTVVDRMNKWSVVVRDGDGTDAIVWDANYEVQGVQLTSMHALSVPESVTVMGLGNDLHMVTIVLTASRDVAAGVLTSFRIDPPAGFTASGGKVMPSLPGSITTPSGSLVVNLGTGQALPQASYRIEVSGSGDPAANDGLWLFQALGGGEVQYQQILRAA